MPNFVLPDGAFEEAARRFPTPFHLYDEQGIRSNARALNAAFSWCEDFEEYFAVKALPNPAILRILKEEKCGVDCSSETELMLAKACGFSGRDVMFSANAMPDDEFRMARELGAYVNLDDISHIDILRALHFESRNSVYDWFAGRSVPTADHLLDLSDLLGCPVESLLVRYGHPSPLQEAAYPGGVIRLGYLRPTKRCMRRILVYGARLLYPMKGAG